MISMMYMGIAKRTELKTCALDVVQTIGLTAVGYLTVLINHERAKLQHSTIRSVKEQ